MKKKTIFIFNCIFLIQTIIMYSQNKYLAGLFIFMDIIVNYGVYLMTTLSRTSNDEVYTQTEIDLVKVAKNEKLVITDRTPLIVKNLVKFMGDLNKSLIISSCQVIKVMKSLVKISFSLKENSGEITQSITDVANDMGAQQEQVVEISDLLDNIVACIDGQSEKVEQAYQVSENASLQVKNCNEASYSMNNQMIEIKASVDDVVKISDELEKKSLGINKIVDLILAIADKTNLLALNAAIEAAVSFFCALYILLMLYQLQ